MHQYYFQRYNLPQIYKVPSIGTETYWSLHYTSPKTSLRSKAVIKCHSYLLVSTYVNYVCIIID